MKTPDRRALRRIELKNLLSFGPDSPALELENLNILIGPNGSGKSNLIEAISLLRSTPIPASASKSSLRGVVTLGGGVDEWIFKGGDARFAAISAEVDCDFRINHSISFKSVGSSFWLRDESISDTDGELYSLGQTARDGAWIKPLDGDKRKIEVRKNDRRHSVLSQIRDEEAYPQLAMLSDVYNAIRIYRDWTFGRSAVFRESQPADMPNDLLEEDFSNLGLVLSRLQGAPKARKAIVAALGDLYDGLSDFRLGVRAGFVDIFLHEGELFTPAKRLSDGTLRYLCLLMILCDPSPPPLICIEEPELGLHPDIIPKLADLLVEASERTQLIVTTHSDVLVDCMTDRPEAIVVCEKKQGQTHMQRLSKPELEPWLENYRLGQLWTDGHLGGNRW